MKNIYFLFCLFINFAFNAQIITLDFPNYKEKKASIITIHGIEKDTIGSVILDKNGQGIFTVDQKQLPGLATLSFKEKPLNYEFIVSSNENPIIKYSGKNEQITTIDIANSPENEHLQDWFSRLIPLKQKSALNDALSKYYKKEDTFSKQLNSEKNIVYKELKSLENIINSSSSYAAKFIKLRVDQEEMVPKTVADDQQATQARNYFKTIDFEALYTSSLWQPIINSCLAAYGKESPFYEKFGTDVIGILKRTQNLETYTALADASISITESFAWNKDQQEIAQFLINDKRLLNPTGKLARLVDIQKSNIGNKGKDLMIFETTDKKEPKITILKTNELSQKYSLLIFYLSDCEHCERELKQLKEIYLEIKNKGFRVISIAGDSDENLFKTIAVNFPWEDKFYEKNGFQGINFQNYGVLGTPTMYVLDKEGVIKARLATMQEFTAFIDKQ